MVRVGVSEVVDATATSAATPITSRPTSTRTYLPR
jgi:hypothetical protein